MPIDDRHKAALEWENFNRKYTSFFKGVSEEKKRFYEQKEISPAFANYLQTKPNANTSAKKIQSFWVEKRMRDTLISVNPNGNHHGAFLHFLNKQPAKKSLNKLKLDTLLKAMTRGHWEHVIFTEETLPQLALALFASQKITQQQMYSILERRQALEDYKLQHSYRIIDEKGNFTHEANTILLPSLLRMHHLKQLSSAQLDTFRLLVGALPLSEQAFYMTSADELNSLGKTLVQSDSIFLKDEAPPHIIVEIKDDSFKNNAILHLSHGALDALGLARFGFNQFIRSMPRLGQQKIQDIEEGVRKGARYAAIKFPDILGYKNIHDFPNVTASEAKVHDEYHSMIMSTFPDGFLQAIWRFVDIAREKTRFIWSKEIWDWIDCDYYYFFHTNQNLLDDLASPMLGIQDMTKLFCHMLNEGNTTTPATISKGGSIMRHGSPTVLGILAFIDMIEHDEKWLELNIDPDQLIEPFDDYYFSIKEIFNDIRQDSPKIQLVKSYLYFLLKQENQADCFSSLNEVLNANVNSILSRITFEKLPRRSIPPLKKSLINTLFISLDGVPINEQTMPYIREVLLNKPDEAKLFNQFRAEQLACLERECLLTLTVDTDDAKNAFRILNKFALSIEDLNAMGSNKLAVWLDYVEEVEKLTDTLKIPLAHIINYALYRYADGVIALERANISLSMLLTIAENEREELLSNAIAITDLVAVNISWISLLTFRKEQRAEIYQNVQAITLLLSAGISLREMMAFDDARRASLFKNAQPIVYLISKAMLSLPDIFMLSSEEQAELYKFPLALVYLQRLGLSGDKFLKLPKDLKIEFLNYTGDLQELKQAGVSYKEITALPTVLRKKLLENSFAFSSFLGRVNKERVTFSLAEVVALDEVIFNELEKKQDEVIALLKAGADFSRLMGLPLRELQEILNSEINHAMNLLEIKQSHYLPRVFK